MSFKRNGRETVTIEADVDVSVQDVLDAMRTEDIRAYLGDRNPRSQFDLDDPVALLGVITELRSRGFVVEPTS